MEYENETIREILKRLSHNSRSDKPKPWAPRVAKIEPKVIDFVLRVCVDEKIDAHEARLSKAAMNSMARNKNDIAKLIKYRRAKGIKSVAAGAAHVDDFVAILGSLHDLLRGAIAPPSRGSRGQQIVAQMEHSICYANESDMACPKIPKDARDALIAWAREQT